MTDIASFRVDFETSDAENNVDNLADATTRAMDQMEDASQSSMNASSQDIERLSEAFRASGNIIESSINALIQKEEELARQTHETAEEGSKFREVFTTIGTGLAAAGAAVAATVTAIGALVQTTTAAIVETDNYAQAVGISTDAMQAFQFAAQRVGGDTDALRESLRTSQDAMAQFVNDGSGPAAEALELFGLQLTDSSGKVRSMEQLLPDLVTALADVQDPAERSRLAIQLFGEEDSRVMLALANNPAILAESTSALEKYGLVMGEDLVQQSREFQTGVTDLMASLQGLAQELVSALLPTLNALLPQFTAWVVSLRESDAVQKELIPTLQAIIGYLATVGVAVDVLKAGWAALNAGFNAAVMVILEGVGKIAQGLGTIITAAGTAADVLGMDGIADKLRSAGTAVTEVGNAADQMGDAARESMNEWQTSLDNTIANLGSTTTATQQTTTATAELGKAATTAGTEVTAASKAMAAEAATAQQQARELRDAYVDLGIKSGEALDKFRTEAVQDFATIRQSGTETPERIADLWEELVPQLVDEYGKLPPQLAQMDRDIMESATRATTEIQQAYDTLGIETTQAAEETARKQIEAFGLIVAEGKKSIEEQRKLYQEVLVPAIEAATGRMAPSFEVFYGIVKNGATDAGEHLKKVFDASGKAIEGTMSSLGKVLTDLGIKTEQDLISIRQTAEQNLLTIVSIFGVRSKEAAQAWDATINDISAGYDRLPPHLERIGRQIAEANQKSGEDSARAHEDAAKRIAAAYSFATRESVARVKELMQEHAQFLDATDRLLDDSGFKWGTTMEELRAQIQRTQEEYNQWSRAVGVDSQLVQLNMERLNGIINELHSRMRDLSESEREATASTNALNTSATGLHHTLSTLTISATLFGKEVELVQNRFGEWRPRIEEVSDGLQETAERTETLSGSLGGVGSAIRTTAGALGELTTAQKALNAAWEASPYSGDRGPGSASMRVPTRTGGGTGSGGSGGGGLTDPGGIDNRDSLVIGQGPGQLPVGVPLPSDLGLPQGGTGFPSTTASFGRSTLTQNTVINVNEPITVQTKADSSLLTSQAIIDAFNEGIRRGVLRPELGNMIR